MYLSVMLVLYIFLVVYAAAATLQLPNKPRYDLKNAHDLFKDYVQEYGKVYGLEEYSERLEIFKQSLKEINERNAKHSLTEFGITSFADMTSEERGYMGGSSDGSLEGLMTKVQYPAEAITAPEQWDWRDHGAVVLEVKDPGKCHADAIFSATGHIEGQYAIKHKKCLDLSEQQSIDCTPPYWDNDNCHFGPHARPHEIMKYYEGYGKYKRYLTLEEEYPYKGKPGLCREKQNMTAITSVTSVKVFNITDEETLKQILYETGPLAIIMNVFDLYLYKGGILVPDLCRGWLHITGAVLLVGYGTENGHKYWICKTSYGPKWGEKGYFRMLRGVHACDMVSEKNAECQMTRLANETVWETLFFEKAENQMKPDIDLISVIIN